MARGQEAKLRRRQNRKNNKDGGADAFDGNDDVSANDADEGIPMPPSMQQRRNKEKVVVETVTEDSDADEDGQNDNAAAGGGGGDYDDMPIRSKKKKKKGGKLPQERPAGGGGGGGGLGNLKTGPLILLVILTGTTVLPALIYASDYIGSFMSKSNVLGNIGFRLGIGAVPKKRVLSFYEKHAPEKLDEVPQILSKYYGDYPGLVKKLERKYGDYGYFIGWEADEAPLVYFREQVQSLYEAWITRYWNRYAPLKIRTAFRNVKMNLQMLAKKFRKVWRKHLWPALEPIFGVPKGTEKQKRQDAAEARKKMYKEKGTRRKNTDFRDDEED